MEVNEQPTMPWHGDDINQGKGPNPGRPLRGISRRKLAVGLACAGGAAVVAGVGVEQFGWLNSIFHGSVAGNAQIGHLLRRAGFGARPEDLSAYLSLGYTGAVDRLLNYKDVSDGDMENHLKGLGLDLNKPQDQ